MKKHLLPAVFGLLLSACNPLTYQVIETRSPQLKIQEGQPVYEDNDLRVAYNFWNNNQMISFDVFNKTKLVIYLDLNKSHLIINGQSFDYYQEGETQSTVKAGNTVSNYGVLSNRQIERSTTSRMKKVVEIPPQSFITVNGLSIISAPFNDCEIKKAKRQPVSKTYSQDNSPLNFRNYLTYGDNQEMSAGKVVDHSFFAEKITVMNELDFRGKTNFVKLCPSDFEKVSVPSMPYSKPQNIFIKMAKN